MNGIYIVEALLGTPNISTGIDCLVGLAIAVSVGLAAWTIWRNRDK
jgi:hypothetical protein